MTAAKRRKLIATAQTYLMDHGIEDRAFRIDVIAVQLTPAAAAWSRYGIIRRRWRLNN